MMMMMFDINIGDNDLCSGLSSLLNGFPVLCGGGQAFDLGDLGSRLSSAR